jgi:hypothetical protein
MTSFKSFLKADAITWIGRVLSIIVVLPFVMSAQMKVAGGPQITEGMAHLGIPLTLLPTLACLEIMCIVIYLIPQTAVFGAILFTGYLGGAICTHLRMGEPVYLQTALGVVIWLGLFLREPRLRQLLPIRR